MSETHPKAPDADRLAARDAVTAAADLLARVSPFAELPPIDRARLAASLEQVHHRAGEVIYAEGDAADALFILREGEVERRDGSTRLASLTAPAVFGDLALIRGERRGSTLVALSPCRLWRLPADRFTALVRRSPGVGARFAAAVGHRLMAARQEAVALGAELEAVAERLYDSLPADQQALLQQVALLPHLDPRVIRELADGATVDALPLADLLVPPSSEGSRAYPVSFRRFHERRLRERLGEMGVANLRRGLAARLRANGAVKLAVAVLQEGGLTDEALELGEREAERLRDAGQEQGVRELARLFPPGLLHERPALASGLDARVGSPAREAVAASARSWRPGKLAIGLTLAVFPLLGGWLLPPPANLSPEGWRAFATLVAVVPLFALEALPEGIIGLCLAAAWAVGGVVTPQQALAGYATPTWVLVVTVIAAGGAIAGSGLLYRLALWVAGHTRGRYARQVFALGLAGILVGPASPNATSRVTLVAPAAREIVEALGYRPRGPAAAGIAMAMLMGFGQMVTPFLTSSTTAVLVYAVLPASTRQSIDWAGWAWRAAPVNILLFLGLMGAILLLYRPRSSDRTGESAVATAGAAMDGLALQRALLGPLSRHERVALAVGAGLVLSFLLQPLHGIDGAWLGVAALVILSASGTFGAEGMRAVNWSFVLLFGMLTSMSSVFALVGLDRWLAGLVTQFLGGLASSPVMFLAALTLVCYGVSLVLRWQAAAPLLTIALVPVGASAGISPFVVGLVCTIACNGFFLSYQSTTYLALYHGTDGRLFSHAQARPLGVAYGVIVLLAVSASVPFWHLMGLL